MSRLRIETYLMNNYPKQFTTSQISKALNIPRNTVNHHLLALLHLAIVERIRPKNMGHNYLYNYRSRLSNRAPKINGELQQIYESIPFGSTVGVTEFIESNQSKTITSHQLRRVLRVLWKDGIIRKVPDMLDIRKNYYTRVHHEPVNIHDFYMERPFK